jgi:hypothetical protein
LEVFRKRSTNDGGDAADDGFAVSDLWVGWLRGMNLLLLWVPVSTGFTGRGEGFSAFGLGSWTSKSIERRDAQAACPGNERKSGSFFGYRSLCILQASML